MTNLIATIYPISHLALALIEWILIGWSVYLWRQSKSLAMIVLPVVLVSISYDNLVLGIGSLIGEGTLLQNLSVGRFLLHDVVIPFFITIGVELAYQASAKWANKSIRILSWLLAIGLAGGNIADSFMGIDLVPIQFDGVLRYVLATVSPPIITIVANVFILLIGIGLWIRLKWQGLFLGSAITLLGNAIPPAMVGTLPGSASEFILALFLVLTEQQILFVNRPIPTKEPPTQERLNNLAKRKEKGYTVYQAGEHIKGNFVQFFVPDVPYYDAHGKLKLITYLHGFALCLPKFYEKHLKFLAQNGYYVLFPAFQKSDYPDDDINQNNLVPSQNKRHLYFWYQMAMDIIAQQNNLTTEVLEDQEEKADELYRILKAPSQPSAVQCFFIALALVVIISAVRLIYIFNPKYSKNLVKLISTVGLSLLYSPSEWIKGSIRRTAKSWNQLCQEQPKLKETDFDFYVFGHSLGGLLALSWPAYVSDPKFFPKQILTADPAPSTEMGIPGIAIWILKLFRSPFTLNPITIQKTGSKLKVPVGILHGVDDTLVKPEVWVKPPLFQHKTNFDYIASEKKKIYFSLSEEQDTLPLIAFHNQAVTDTTYFDNDLFENFGGAKANPNAYNFEYIWPGLDLVVTNQVNANQLLPNFPLNTIQVTDTLPLKRSQLTWILPIVELILCGLAYWAWQAEIFAFSL
ncbi:MAG: hypothetical protein ACRC06_11375 [Waterburya sp.]